MTWLFGALAGIVITYLVGWVPITVVTPAPASTAPPAVTPTLADPPLTQQPTSSPPAASARSEVDAQPEPAPTPTSAEPLAGQATAEPADPAAALLLFAAKDEEGDARPPAVAVLVTPTRALVPLQAILGASDAVLQTAAGGRHTVVAVVAHSAPHDLALLEIAAPIVDVALPIRSTPIQAGAAATLLWSDRSARGGSSPLALFPGEIDLLSGGPRLRAEPAVRHTGAAMVDGQLVALFSSADAPGLPVAIAAPWLEQTHSTPFDTFLRILGPGAPASRLARARKLLDSGRFDEAARAYLVITAEEPRLLDQVRDDLERACDQAVQRHITSGNGPAALALLSETLLRLPESADLWAQRGRALALYPDLRGAVAAFQTAADRDPALADAYLDEARGLLLGEVNVLKGLGQHAGAIALLLELRGAFPRDGRLRMTAGDLLLAARRFREAADLYTEAAIADAQVSGEARRNAEHARDLAGGPGAIVIDYPPGSREIVLDCRIDGAVPVRLRLDDSEELVVLPRWAVQRAGYPLANVAHRQYTGDPGGREHAMLPINGLSAQGSAALRVDVVVIDDRAAPAADGVLGRSFLGRFRRVEDSSLGRLVLHPR